MLRLLLWLALLLPGRVPDPAGLHHRDFDPTHQGLDVQSWLRRTPEGKPDLARTALDIRHNALLRGAGAGLGWSLLLLAFARRRGWARTPWRMEGQPGSALHNGTKAIHLGTWAGAMGLGMAILNGVGESLEPGQSRLPEAILLAGEGLCLLGAAGVWARRLDKKRPSGVVHRIRRCFDAFVASTPQETPPEVSLPRYPEGFDPTLLERRAGEDWEPFQAAWAARDMVPVAHRLTKGLAELLRTRLQALSLLERRDRRDGAALRNVAFVHLHEDGSGASATLRLSLRGRSSPGAGAPDWTEMWTLVRGEPIDAPTRGLADDLHPQRERPPETPRGHHLELPDRGVPPRSGAHDWLVASIVPESEWASPDPQRLERLAPLVRNDPRDTFRHIEDVALGAFAQRIRSRNANTASIDPHPGKAPEQRPLDPIVPLVLAVDAMTAEVGETESVAWVAVSWLVDLPSTDPEVDAPRRTLLRLVRPTSKGPGPEDGPAPQEPPAARAGTRCGWAITEISGDDLLETQVEGSTPIRPRS